MAADTDKQFENLLEFLRQSRGFDFGAYKRTSLLRRVQKRVEATGSRDIAAYQDHLEVHPDEFEALFDTILINVTSFFRDPESWEYLQGEIAPRILAGKSERDPVRIWSAGCSSGEEACSLAIVLAEAMGEAGFRERAKIYATDVDEDALAHARQALYSEKSLENVPQEVRDKYFERQGGHWIFSRELRRSIVYGRHNLLQDAPISKLDLLACRNVLMYFSAQAQSEILTRFYFALLETGFLFLGKAEMLFTRSNFFTPVDLKRRVFAPLPKQNGRERLLLVAQTGRQAAPQDLGQSQVREVAFEADPIAQLVVDAAGVLILANEHARRLFGLTPQDLNRPLQDLELSYRPFELRSEIDRVRIEGVPVTLKALEWKVGGTTRWFEVEIRPLRAPLSGTEIGTHILFSDVSAYRRLELELQESKQELETAYEELQSTNEELETTNEELQSTVEELETTNEELQSTNEELESMNEELQSTNEELQTINQELRQRGAEVQSVNAFHDSVLDGLGQAVIVVDSDLAVQVWNGPAEELWGLREHEVVQRQFFSLEFGLPTGGLVGPLKGSLADGVEQQVVLDAVTRRGKRIRCRVRCAPLKSGNGVLLQMSEVPAASDAGA